MKKTRLVNNTPLACGSCNALSSDRICPFCFSDKKPDLARQRPSPPPPPPSRK